MNNEPQTPQRHNQYQIPSLTVQSRSTRNLSLLSRFTFTTGSSSSNSRWGVGDGRSGDGSRVTTGSGFSNDVVRCFGSFGNLTLAGRSSGVPNISEKPTQIIIIGCRSQQRSWRIKLLLGQSCHSGSWPSPGWAPLYQRWCDNYMLRLTIG